VSLVVNTFPQAFLEVLHHSLQHVGRNCCHFFPDVLFKIHRCPWFIFLHLALEISSEEGVLRLGTLVLINIEVPSKYPLSQDRIVVFEIRLHSKSPILYRPALHGNSDALSLARRALKENSPRQRFHSQLFCKIVRYFCRNLYHSDFAKVIITVFPPPVWHLFVQEFIREGDYSFSSLINEFFLGMNESVFS
jgi:hypothetical protein